MDKSGRFLRHQNLKFPADNLSCAVTSAISCLTQGKKKKNTRKINLQVFNVLWVFASSRDLSWCQGVRSVSSENYGNPSSEGNQRHVSLFNESLKKISRLTCEFIMYVFVELGQGDEQLVKTQSSCLHAYDLYGRWWITHVFVCH